MICILLASLACLSVTHPSPRNQTQHQLPKIPFLKEVDSTGKEEFVTIFADKDVTRPQFDAKLFEWAEKFNVTESVKKFKAKMEKDKSAAEEELQEALTRLSQFFRENKEIADDNNITWAQADHDREQLLLNLTVKQQQAAFMLSELYAPVDEEGEKQYGPVVKGEYPNVTYPDQGYDQDGESSGYDETIANMFNDTTPFVAA